MVETNTKKLLRRKGAIVKNRIKARMASLNNQP